MRRVLALLLILASLSTASAEEKKVQPPAAGQEEQAQPETTPQVWPLPFQPSEEIGADSHISFPTDI